MKKTWKIWILSYATYLVPVALAIINNVVLLNLHPLEYYYTPTGMLLTAVVMLIESPLILPVMWRIGVKLGITISEEEKKDDE